MANAACRLQNTSNRHSHKLRAGPDDRPDLITRMVGKIFGKAALEDRKPFGMQRMSEESMQELYPATTTEFAGAVEGDSPEVALFRPLLAKTRLEKKGLRWSLPSSPPPLPPVSSLLLSNMTWCCYLATSYPWIAVEGYSSEAWSLLAKSRL